MMKTLIDQNGELLLDRDFLAEPEASSCFASLTGQLAWQQERYTIYGKSVLSPRLMCWYGDEQAVYRYSGVTHLPLPWNSQLLSLKQKIERQSGYDFNAVLANLYRDGNDSMGWHADNEPELGEHPVIASLSLGAERVFKVRHNRSKQVMDILLPSGSLLLMTGSFQANWKHSLPKTRKPVQARINLTFRKIISTPV